MQRIINHSEGGGNICYHNFQYFQMHLYGQHGFLITEEVFCHTENYNRVACATYCTIVKK